MAEVKKRRVGRPPAEMPKIRKTKRFLDSYIEGLCDALSAMYEARFKSNTLEDFKAVTVADLEKIVIAKCDNEMMMMYNDIKARVYECQLTGQEVPQGAVEWLEKAEKHIAKRESLANLPPFQWK